MIVFASNNKNKLEEVKAIFDNTLSPIVSLNDISLNINPIEDGKTYKENAHKKALAVMQATNRPTLADDSGIEIEFFNNDPGVNSSTFLTSNSQYKKRNYKILELMNDALNRKAVYVCTLLLYLPTGETYFTTGRLEGTISYTPMGSNGFAYDEIFYVKQYNATLAQITLNEKNKISHRNIALTKMKKILTSLGL